MGMDVLAADAGQLQIGSIPSRTCMIRVYGSLLPEHTKLALASSKTNATSLLTIRALSPFLFLALSPFCFFPSPFSPSVVNRYGVMHMYVRTRRGKHLLRQAFSSSNPGERIIFSTCDTQLYASFGRRSLG